MRFYGVMGCVFLGWCVSPAVAETPDQELTRLREENRRLQAIVSSLREQVNLLFTEALMKTRPVVVYRVVEAPSNVVLRVGDRKLEWIRGSEEVFHPEPEAQRILFLVDASGSLIQTMPFIQQSLITAIDRLNPQAQFNVMFFQRDEAMELPAPALGWKTASPESKRAAEAWLDRGAGNVVARGSTDPRPAIEKGLAQNPDVVYLLSDRITGRGARELHRGDLLKLIDAAAPKNVRLHTIQWLDHDPLETMLEIARRHQGTARIITREDLGLPAE